MLLPTAKQKAVLCFIESYSAEHGFSPVVNEIAANFGWKSDNAAYLHLLALKRKGFINMGKRTARGITIVRYERESEARELFGRIVMHHEYFVEFLKKQPVTA